MTLSSLKDRKYSYSSKKKPGHLNPSEDTGTGYLVTSIKLWKDTSNQAWTGGVGRQQQQFGGGQRVTNKEENLLIYIIYVLVEQYEVSLGGLFHSVVLPEERVVSEVEDHVDGED